MKVIIWCLLALVCISAPACAQKTADQRYTKKMAGYQRRMEKLQAQIEQEQKREMERIREAREQKE